MITARAYPDIALIKYWGNRNNALRLPAAHSIAMALDRPSVEIDIEHASVLMIRSFDEKGTERILTEKQLERFRIHLELTKKYLASLGYEHAIPASVSFTIRSGIPPSIGLASSTAVFGCLAKALVGLLRDTVALDLQQQSIIGRFGSGSAARTVYGGFVAFIAEDSDALDASSVVQIAPQDHWPLHDIVIVPDHTEKKVGSTEAHALAGTSPLFASRVEAIRNRRQQECTDAILNRDFEKLSAVVEEDALDMHRVMQTSTPSINYLSPETHRILREIEELRTREHLPVLYTMDAGPTVHLLCTPDAAVRVGAFADTQKGCTIFRAKTGPGATLVS